MSVAVAEEPRVLHSLPGRVRVHLPGWSGQSKLGIEKKLRQVWGVRSVQANPLTGNILVQFDPAITNEQTIVELVRTIEVDVTSPPVKEPPPAHVLRERHRGTVRARIAVRGLDRDPHLARRVLEHLGCRPGVRASVNRLTGRVLVEFEEHEEVLEDIISEITGLELPELPGEDHPAHPLDPGPLVQSTTRTIGATLGLALHAVRQLLGSEEPLPGASAALHAASIIGLLQGLPPIRFGLRKLLGRTVADLVVHIPGIISLTLGGSVLGLAVVGTESLRMVTEVQARREAWRRHEQRERHAPSSQPDAVIRLETGERTPHAAEVLEGTGTAIGRDALPLPVVQGVIVPPGARLYGGPFVLKLRHSDSFEPFIPTPRPFPITPSLHDHYLRVLSPLSLLYAAGTALLTR